MTKPEGSSSDFAYQIREWAHPQAIKALENGFYIETLVISLNAINAILRESILNRVMEDIVYEHGDGYESVETFEEHPYLVSLLTDYDNPLAGGAPDSAVYVAATQLRIIDDKELKNLRGLYRQRNDIFHRLFGRVIFQRTSIEPTTDGQFLGFGHFYAIDPGPLKTLAGKYLAEFERLMEKTGFDSPTRLRSRTKKTE